MNRLRVRGDVGAGVLFLLCGALALWVGPAENGDATNMAAGYFPTLLGYLLCAVGLGVVATGVRLTAGDTEQPSGLSLRPFFVIAGVVAFALLLERVGLVLAGLALLAIGAIAARGLALRHFAALAVALLALVLAIFVWGIGLTVKVWPG